VKDIGDLATGRFLEVVAFSGTTLALEVAARTWWLWFWCNNRILKQRENIIQ
jgi:hypothetical protein